MFENFLKVKTISLALGSGSAKGAAHIGVIKTLEENRCKIKALAGTSMGAIVASYYAFGKLNLLEDWLISLSKASAFRTLDFSVSGGFISGNKLMKHFENHLGSVNIEDSPLPLFIVAANLDTGAKEVFDKGPLIPAIRASISIPGVFKPYFYKGTYFADGALIDPVPVTVLKERGFKNIVAVCLNEYLGKRKQEEKLSISETFTRSVTIAARALANNCQNCSLATVKPNLSSYSMFEIHKAKEIIEIGHQAAQNMINSGGLNRFKKRKSL